MPGVGINARPHFRARYLDRRVLRYNNEAAAATVDTVSNTVA